VLATQTLWQKEKSKNMLVRFEGKLPLGCTVKDVGTLRARASSIQSQ
jgi:homoaconitase/3-isopropylmalate dehydratase large subunit